MNLGTTEAIKNFLENFDGIALVSEWAVKREVIDKRLKILDIKGLKITRELHAHWVAWTQRFSFSSFFHWFKYYSERC